MTFRCPNDNRHRIFRIDYSSTAVRWICMECGAEVVGTYITNTAGENRLDSPILDDYGRHPDAAIRKFIWC